MRILIISIVVLISSFTYSQASKVWGITVNGTAKDVANIVKEDASGNVYVGGSTHSDSVDFDPGSGFNYLSDPSLYGTCFVAKYDNSGNHLWAFTLEGSTQSYVTDMAVDANGGIFVIGMFEGTVNFNPAGVQELTAGSQPDAFLVHYQANGDFDYVFSITGTGTAFANNIALDGDGNIILSGKLTNVSDFDPSGTTVNLNGDPSGPFLAKYTAFGSLMWAWVSPSNGSPNVNDVKIDANNNILLAGTYTTSIDLDPTGIAVLTAEDLTDGFVAKYSSAGAYIWGKGFQGNRYEFVQELEILNDGSLIVVGNYDGTIDLDPSASNNIIPTNNRYNGFMVHLDANGDYDTGTTISSSGDIRINTIRVNAAGNLTMCGYFNGAWEPSPGLTHIPYGGKDIFVLELSPSFTYSNSFVVGGYNDEGMFPNGMTTIGNDIVVVGGYDVNFDFAPGNVDDPAPVAAGNLDIYVARYSFGQTNGLEDLNTKNIYVSPNPVENELFLNGDLKTSGFLLRGLDGKLVKQGQISLGNSIDVGDLKSGVYFIELEGRSLRFIKQ